MRRDSPAQSSRKLRGWPTRRWPRPTATIARWRRTHVPPVRICPVFDCGHFLNSFTHDNLFHSPSKAPDTNRTLLKCVYCKNRGLSGLLIREALTVLTGTVFIGFFASSGVCNG